MGLVEMNKIWFIINGVIYDSINSFTISIIVILMSFGYILTRPKVMEQFNK